MFMHMYMYGFMYVLMFFGTVAGRGVKADAGESQEAQRLSSR